MQTFFNIQDHLKELSDLNIQKGYWLDGSANHISSYEELMCRFFDDDRFDLFIDEMAPKFGFSETEIQELNKLRDMLNNYVPVASQIEILNDPNWHTVIAQAAIAKTIFDAKT